jgi:Cys-tRNA(Pro)/Cys-tRNA(Cys) deacylase
LARRPVVFTERRHSDFPEPIQTATDFARQLGYELARITKTLFVRSSAGAPFALAVASIGKKTQFSALATQLGVKRVEVASASELTSVTGYPQHGVSPLGVEGIKVFVDSGLLNLSTILVGAGVVGVEIEMKPADLVSLADAICFPFAA